MTAFRFFVVVLTVLLVAGYAMNTFRFGGRMITIETERGNVHVGVEEASTQAEHERGLMDVSYLPEERGMIFLFSDQSIKTFWNQRTHISLDVIWITGDHIVGVDSLPAVDHSGIVYIHSPVPVDRVLEVNAGWADRHGISKGQRVYYP